MNRILMLCLLITSTGILAPQHLAAQSAAPPKSKNEIKIYHLKHVSANQMPSMLVNLLPMEQARLSVDSRMNAIILSAPPETQSDVVDLLSVLDQPSQLTAPEQPTVVSRNIQVAWLISGDKTAGKELPAEFSLIAKALSKKGVDNLQLAALTTTRAIEGGSFAVQSSPSLQNQQVNLTIQGELSRITGDSNFVSLTAKAVTDSNASAVLASLESVIAAPTSHPVVLAVAPLQKSTSVFVITISTVD